MWSMRLGLPAPTGSSRRVSLEGIACSDVLQLLGHLRGRLVQLLRHALLLVGVHAVELLTQVSVDHVLGDGKRQEATA